MTVPVVTLKTYTLLNVDVRSFFIEYLNPQAPVAQKVADEVVFRRFRGEGVEFFQIGPH